MESWKNTQQIKNKKIIYTFEYELQHWNVIKVQKSWASLIRLKNFNLFLFYSVASE